MKPATGRVLRRLATVAIVGLIFVFMGRALYRSWQQVPFAELKFQPWLLVASYLLLLVFFHLGVFGWTLILRRLGARLSFAAATAIYSTAQFGHYLPGKVWFAVGRMVLAKRENVSEKLVGVSVILESAFLAVASLILFLTALFFFPRSALAWNIMLPVLLLPVGLVMLYPPLFTRTLNFLLVKVGRQPVELSLRYGDMLLIVLLYVGLWVGQALAVYLLVLSFYHLAPQALPVLVGGYAASWVAGFLVLLVPGGLGVREGLFSLLLRNHLPLSMTIIVSVVARVWITLGEVLFFVVSLVWVKLWRKYVQEKSH